MEKVKVVKLDTNPAQQSVGDLRKELKELRNTMLSCEKGTDDYNKALQQAADIQHTLKEQMEEVNASAMDFGQITSNVVKGVGGMVAGFQAANAVLNLFGIENEDVIKSLKKMQDLMALTQALPAIDNAVKAFKRLSLAITGAAGATSAFSKALISTGLGAVIAALGLLIANWDRVSEAMKKSKIASTIAEDALERQRKKIEGLREEIAKLENKYNEYLKDKQISKLNDEARKSYDKLGETIQELTLKVELLKKTRQLPENQNGDLFDWFNEEDFITQTEEQINQLKNQQKAILDNADSYKELGNNVDKTKDKTKELSKEIEILLWDSTQKITPKSLQEELNEKFGEDPLSIPAKIEIEEPEDEDSDFIKKADEKRKSIEDVVNGLRNAFKTPDEQYAEEQRALDVALNTKLISEEEYYRLSEQLANEHKEAMRRKAVQEAQIWMAALGNLGSTFASIGDMIDRSTEEGEEKYKALMYTSTVVSMLAGIGGAIASAYNPVNAYLTIFGQIAMAATTSASVLASGIAQLMQIKNANKNSTLGGGGASFATPSTNAVNNIIAPVQYTQDVQGASIEGAIRDSKVYVTESDITNTQRRVMVTEDEARF